MQMALHITCHKNSNMENTMTIVVMLVVAIIAVILLIAVLTRQTEGNKNLLESFFSSFSKAPIIK